MSSSLQLIAQLRDLSGKSPSLFVEVDALLVLGSQCANQLFTVALVRLQLTAEIVAFTEYCSQLGTVRSRVLKNLTTSQLICL